MKHKYFLWLALAMPTMLVAANKYVTPTGDDSNDGKSWDSAYETVQKGVWNTQAGDTVFVAAGTYYQGFSITDGVHVFGGYDPKTGVRNTSIYETILDGKDLGKYIVVKYDNGCTNPTVIDGITFQNAEHASEGGGAYIRDNITMNNCIVRNCSGSNGGGIFVNGAGTVSNCLIELCSATSSGGAIRNKGGLVENCIIRGCQGKYAALRNDAGTVRNCLLYNNEATVSGWPNSGGIYNPGGTVINCTLARNKGEGYAGIHSDKQAINCIAWGNQTEVGFVDPENYIAVGNHNACDHGFEEASFSLTLSTENMDAKGPQFVAPTSFAGIPRNDAEIAAMRAADFHLLSTSPCINQGTATDAPATDLEGVARPKGSGVDMGAYEYDPAAQSVAVTGITMAADSIFVYEESTAVAMVIFSPANATNRKVTWSIDKNDIATVDAAGVVTGVKAGIATLTATAEDGGYKATAIVKVSEKPIVIIHHEVLEADALYAQEDYTVPSFTPFYVAKELARKDSTEENLQAMRDAILQLVDYRMPYNVVATINGDAKTQMAFTWFTNGGVSTGDVQIIAGENKTEADFAAATTVKAEATTTKPLRYAVSTSGIIKATGMSNKTAYTYVSHKAMATDLTPGTTYSYRVGFGEYWSPIQQFTTAKANKDAFKFVVMSDSHIMDAEYVGEAHKCAVAAAAHATDASFLVFPGDFVETGTEANSEWEWEQWFEAMQPMLSKFTCAPTDGNHDDSPNLNYVYHFNTDKSFNEQATIKPQFDGITYSFVYGDALIMVYSHQDFWRGSYSYTTGTSSYLTNDVAPWFREQVAKHPEAKWRIAVVHKNLFCGSGHQEDEDGALFRATLLPVFRELNIDLAIQGHDHTYEVMGPINEKKQVVEGAVEDVETVAVNTVTNMTGKKGGTYNVDEGTMFYVGATCGRKRYYPYTREQMDANYSKTGVQNYFDLFTGRFGQPEAPTYTEVTVDSESIRLEAYTADAQGNSTLFDSFTIVRKERVNTSIPTTTSDGVCSKVLRDGQILIIRDDIAYSLLGMRY